MYRVFVLFYLYSIRLKSNKYTTLPAKRTFVELAKKVNIDCKMKRSSRQWHYLNLIKLKRRIRTKGYVDIFVYQLCVCILQKINKLINKLSVNWVIYRYIHSGCRIEFIKSQKIYIARGFSILISAKLERTICVEIINYKFIIFAPIGQKLQIYRQGGPMYLLFRDKNKFDLNKYIKSNYFYQIMIRIWY